MSIIKQWFTIGGAKIIKIRKAVDADRKQIAYCIAEAFEKDFSALCKDVQIVADAIESGIHIQRFYVAVKKENAVIGALAVADCDGRGLLTDANSYKKHFGFVKGMIAYAVLKEEFEKQLQYPDTVGYIEFVCVLKRYQRKGITTKMLEYALNNSDYIDYELDVTNINHGAIRCYEKFGFLEYKREKVKHAKQKGFEEKIFMRYQSQAI